MTCGLCRRLQEDGFLKDVDCRGVQTVSECPTGERPKLSRENAQFWRLFDRMMFGLIRPDSFDYSAIITVFDLYQVPAAQRPVLHDKCLVVISAICEIRQQIRNQQSHGG